MKKMLTLLLLACSSYCSDAQKLSIGVKTGMTNWISSQNRQGEYFRKGTDGQARTWEKEVFVRLQGEKLPIAVEIGLNHNKRTMTPFGTKWGCVMNSDYDSVYTEETSQLRDINISLQYRVSPKCLEKCP